MFARIVPYRMFARLLAAMSLVAVLPVLAQTMPTQPGKPVTLVVSFPPGGGVDPIARILSQSLQARWKTPVVVSNRPGAAGHLGNDSVAHAEPDGHTLLVTANTFAMATHVLPQGIKTPADVVQDFTPLLLVSSSPMLLLAHPDLKVKNVRELVQLARNTPELGYATPGAGSPMHIAGELFNKASGLRLMHVPYKGVGPAVNDALGGHVKLIYLGLPAAKPHIDAGRLVPLAVVDKLRSPLMPNVPTMAEQGFPGVEIDIWFGVYGPRNMPRALADDLHRTLDGILRLPEVEAQFKGMNQVVQHESRAFFADKTRADHVRYGALIREFGIKAD